MLSNEYLELERETIWLIAGIIKNEKRHESSPLDVQLNNGSMDLEDLEGVLYLICNKFKLDIERVTFQVNERAIFLTQNFAQKIWKNRTHANPFFLRDLMEILDEEMNFKEKNL